ncbi:MAG TPA: 2OG-Fe dioxygenase family protein, partial [Rhizobacter sp.]|nr:2OG-Fe dioxygenase family protein [Rhizobacter sp.]
MIAHILPPFTEPSTLSDQLRSTGQVVISPATLSALLDTELGQLDTLKPSWNDLPADTYLRDGGRYRRRRHACFIVDGPKAELVPRRAHWQPIEYNALHGGLERWFEPVAPAVLAQPAWTKLLTSLSRLCSAIKGDQPWYVEAHQFRIDT